MENYNLKNNTKYENLIEDWYTVEIKDEFKSDTIILQEILKLFEKINAKKINDNMFYTKTENGTDYEVCILFWNNSILKDKIKVFNLYERQDDEEIYESLLP